MITEINLAQYYLRKQEIEDAGFSSGTASAIKQAIDGKADNLHDQSSSTVIELNALNNLGTNENTTQQAINKKIDEKIGFLSSIKALEVVTNLPTASTSTMNKLYIISENNEINVYYTTVNNSKYSWHKMDTDILDNLSVSWTDIIGKPTTFTPSSHKHGSLTNDGNLSDDIETINKIVVTNGNNNLKTTNKIPFNNLDILQSDITNLGIPTNEHTHNYLPSNKDGVTTGNITAITTGKGIITANQFKVNGSNNGLLKTDGSIDSNDYLTISSASSTYLSKKDANNNYMPNISISTAITNDATTIPSTKAVYDGLNGKASADHTHSNYLTSLPISNTIKDDNTTIPSTKAVYDVSYGWTYVQDLSAHSKLYVNRNIKMCMATLQWNGISLGTTDVHTITADNTKTIPAEYRPTQLVTAPANSSGYLTIWISPAGAISCRQTKTGTHSYDISCTLMWGYGI